MIRLRAMSARLRKPRLPGEHMIVLLQQRDGLTVPDRVRRIATDRIASWVRDIAEPNLPVRKKLGQVSGLGSSNSRRISPSAETASWAGPETQEAFRS